MTFRHALSAGVHSARSGHVASALDILRLVLLAVLVSGSLSACIVAPVPLDRVHGSAANVDPLAIKVGVTTQEDLLLRLGDPDEILVDDHVFAYQWDRVKWGILVLVATQAGIGGQLFELPTHEMLLVQFDKADRVQRVDRAVRPGDVKIDEFLRNWAKGGTGAKP